jgi:hypothetical protein
VDIDRRRTRPARIRLVIVTIAGLVVGSAGFGSLRADATPRSPERSESATQETPVTQAEEGGQRGEISVEVDALRAETPVVGSTLDDLTENVASQLAELEQARADLLTAETAVDTAEAVVAETEGRIDELVAESDRVAIEAFVMPPAEAGIEVFESDSLTDAAVKQSLLDREATASADVLEELDTAREEVEVQRAAEEDAVGAAESAVDDAEAQLSDLESAQSQQALFVAQVQQRLDRRLAEADALEALDPETAQRIRDRELQLAGQIEEIRNAAEMQDALAALQLAQEQAEAEARAEAERLAEEAARLGDVGGPSGSLVDVACPGGGSITVDSAMGPNLEAMLAAASGDGITLCGGGYRSPDAQVELRRQNCGTSQYAIWEAPSSSCSPPTARPGSSNHEQGLAVDFTCSGSLIESQGSSCFTWMDANAASYGFYNLPSEPWHWSNDGT